MANDVKVEDTRVSVTLHKSCFGLFYCPGGITYLRQDFRALDMVLLRSQFTVNTCCVHTTVRRVHNTGHTTLKC